MNNIENTTTDTAASNVTAAPVVEAAKAKKQFTVNTTEADKILFEEFCKEHSGPSKADKDKPKFLTSHEGFSAILEVATSRRFETVYTMNETGEDYVYDEDGQPITEVIDHLEMAANRIIAKRDEVDLEKQVAELKAKLALLENLGWSKK